MKEVMFRESDHSIHQGSGNCWVIPLSQSWGFNEAEDTGSRSLWKLKHSENALWMQMQYILFCKSKTFYLKDRTEREGQRVLCRGGVQVGAWGSGGPAPYIEFRFPLFSSPPPPNLTLWHKRWRDPGWERSSPGVQQEGSCPRLHTNTS